MTPTSIANVWEKNAVVTYYGQHTAILGDERERRTSYAESSRPVSLDSAIYNGDEERDDGTTKCWNTNTDDHEPLDELHSIVWSLRERAHELSLALHVLGVVKEIAHAHVAMCCVLGCPDSLRVYV